MFEHWEQRQILLPGGGLWIEEVVGVLALG